MASWWWSRREAGDQYTKGDQLYDEAIRLTHSGSDAEAQAAADAAVCAYREILERTAALEAKRRLAKALWRQALLLAKLGKPGAAIEKGVHGIDLGREVLDATASEDPAFDEIVREVAIAMNDLAQAAGRAGRLELYRDLLKQAMELSSRSHGPAARQALGTSLHNLAQWAYEMTRTHGTADPDRAIESLRLALGMADGALSVREDLVKSSDEPVLRWELANSLSLLGELQCYASDATWPEKFARAHDVLVDLESPAFDDLRAKISAKSAEMKRMVTAVARGKAPVAIAADRPCPCGSGLPFAGCHGTVT